MTSQEHALDDLPTEVIVSIARHVFGSATKVQQMDKLLAGVSNQPYKITLIDHEHPYVFRFRLRGENNYQREVQNYQLIHQLTGITVPQIYCVDLSKDLVSSSYMVMDYLEGLDENESLEAGADLIHIQKQVGTFTARVHQGVREAPSTEEDMSHLKVSLDWLEDAVKSGYVDLDLDILENCKRAVQSEPKLKSYNECFCLSDTELYYNTSEEDCRLSFILDPEWANYRTVQYDLWSAIATERTDWSKSLPVKFLTPEEAATKPFFQGDQQIASVDYEKLYYVAPYYQLCLWGNLMENWKTDSHTSRSVGEIHSNEIRELANIVSRKLD